MRFFTMLSASFALAAVMLATTNISAAHKVAQHECEDCVEVPELF